MTKEEKKQVLEYLNRTAEPTFLQRAPKDINGHATYVCPVCGNGSGDDGTGIALNLKSADNHRHWKCFKCSGGNNSGDGTSRDLWELFHLSRGYTDKGESLNGLLEYFGYSVGDDFTEGDSTQYTEDGFKPSQRNAAAYIAFCAKHIAETDYLEKRGISLETCVKFGIGYDSLRVIGKTKEGTNIYAPAVIFPTSADTYNYRLTSKDGQGSKGKSKTEGEERGNVFFNSDSLYTEDKQPIFIVEGDIDALSIIEAGGQAVALGGIAHKALINTLIPEREKDGKAKTIKPPKVPLVIALDNDTAGQQAADKIESILNETHGRIPFYRPKDIFSGCKDANEYLVKHGVVAMQKELRRITDKERDDYLKSSTGEKLQDFMESIKYDTPCTPTGFTCLDTVLEGGLRAGLYVVGAIPSLGKTAFVMQIADFVASLGKDVLIISMEMGENELIARSISRHTFERVDTTDGLTARDAKTCLGITIHSRYARYSRQEKQLIRDSITDYSEYANRIWIYEGVGDINAEEIRGKVAKHIRLTDNPDKIPLVIVDYTQILAPFNDRATDKQNTDKNVVELKRICRDFKIPIIAISSFNRMNYNRGAAMENFKESGAIEYTADVLIGLQLAGMGEGTNFDIDAAKRSYPRAIELKILKNRAGKTGGTITYDYYAPFNYFIETGETLD